MSQPSPQTTLKKQVTHALYAFEAHRNRYQLCPHHTGFFKSYKNFEEFQQQLRTILAAPLHLFTVIHSILNLLKNICLITAGLVTLIWGDTFLLQEGLKEFASDLVRLIVCPIVTCAVTVAAIIALFSRSMATCGLVERNENEFKLYGASCLPENPLRPRTPRSLFSI